jgi:acetoin utilization deacetylase AcuC-like enzyme/uracil DNA glycosylase
MVPLIYHPSYNITAFGLERLHPFDGRKYRRIRDSLVARGLRRAGDFVRPLSARTADLLRVHTPEYLRSIRSRETLADILEVPIVRRLPVWLIDWRVLAPMRQATGGTILACRMALERGVAINLGGGYHHAAAGWGGGFCAYADVPLAAKILHDEGRVSKVLVVDLDAHQGNGTAAIFQDWPWASIFDLYERDIFPSRKEPEDYPLPVRSRLTGPEYLDIVRDSLPAALDAVGPDLVIYNAGSDPYADDPLAGFLLTRDDLAERDLLVVTLARERGIPVAMVLSGGYSAESWRIHADAIEGILTRFDPGPSAQQHHDEDAMNEVSPQSALSPSPDDPLALAELFRGGGEPWLPLLKPTIERRPNAATFIGPGRPKGIVPVRELTFQALKPNPPGRWKVVIFGQNPYPRVESATGIAMFDNTFHDWKDSQFGRVTSIRCIIKAASIWKHGIKKATPIAEIRRLLAEHKTVQPPEWFQAMLTQGVLLLNAALTASSDGALTTEEHTAFWRPVIEAIVEEILKAKHQGDGPRGVVFAWWGAHARNLRGVVERLETKYPNALVRHVDYCNPAAQGDIFCDRDHFADLNRALTSLGMDEVDWLPTVGWDKALPAQPGAVGHAEEAGRMGEFIAQTMELHKFYLERLQGVKDEVAQDLPAIAGILATPLMGFADAMGPVVSALRGLDAFVARAIDFARKNRDRGAAEGLDEHEIAALHLYTTESAFYRQLNAALRDPDRSRVRPYFGYLRLLFSALAKLGAYRESLWRGVALDLRAQYPHGGVVTWWGVSSCTSKLSVARGFLGVRGRRMLFEVRPTGAVSIKKFSAFTGEDEYILAPGSRLKVTGIKNEPGGLCVVSLEELADQRMVC